MKCFWRNDGAQHSCSFKHNSRNIDLVGIFIGNIDCLYILTSFYWVSTFYLMALGKLFHSTMQHTPRMEMNLLMQQRQVSIPTTQRRNAPNGPKDTIEPDSCMSAIEMFLQGDCLTSTTQVVKHLKYSVKHRIEWFIPKSWII